MNDTAKKYIATVSKIMADDNVCTKKGIYTYGELCDNTEAVDAFDALFPYKEKKW